MKHGPIALIDKDMPVVVLAPRDRLYDKTVSNLMEVKARRAPVIAFVAEGERELGKIADAVFTIPDTHSLISPILFTIPLQLLAYRYRRAERSRCRSAEESREERDGGIGEAKGNKSKQMEITQQDVEKVAQLARFGGDTS